MKRIPSQLLHLLPRRRDYHGLRRTWRSDLLAGLTVAIVALPLALGFGISSGAGAEAGLITAIVAGVVAAVFGGSNVQVSGPTGAMVVVLAPIVATHGVAAVALVSVLAGAIVLLAGVLRLGRSVSFIPWPVIEGFTLGIGVIIFLQQVPALSGAEDNGAGHTNVVVTAARSLADADRRYLVWALGAVVIVAACMVLLPRLHRAIPGSLLGIAIVSGLALVLPTPLAVIGELPGELPAPHLPLFDQAVLISLLLPAVTVAALAGIESLLSARVAASMADTGRYDPDRELVGQGMASVAAGLFGGMPATGAIARTAVGVRSGARTRLAAASHAVILLVIVMAVAGPVGHIPLAALSGVLMVTAIRMIDLRTAWSILRSTRADATAFVVTAIITVSVDLIIAVMIGLLVAGVFALRGLARSSTVEREELPGAPRPDDDRIALLRLDGPLFFAPADRIQEVVTDVDSVSVVILRMSRVQLLDATGARALAEIVQRCEARGVTVLIKGVRDGHAALLHRVGTLDALRHQNHLFTDLPAAVAHARSHTARERDAAATVGV
ncbi:SulP family inorganic anion transporter [Spiractinospora alimapuensis]|uniref:SulP family inorganic anion transporter n=1 Tax=Spiractinospora alimapuensis TaxID=2820884 RepID=UPI001F35F97C|nr:SulP family inorganic anion transporter [Spiractinospora alimapuensis]QVQ53760.1 SulP family inorganic anion transporter [Spiractinospora alimapuensis]